MQDKKKPIRNYKLNDSAGGTVIASLTKTK